MNKQEILDALNECKTLSNGLFAVRLTDDIYYEEFTDTMEVIFKHPENWEILDD